jgi:hypothetical protein
MIETSLYQSEVEKRDSLAVFGKCMQTHKHDAVLTQLLCSAIGLACVSNARNQDRCFKLGILDLLLEALERHKDKLEVLYSARIAIGNCTDGHETNTAYVKRVMTPQQAKRLHRSGSKGCELLNPITGSESRLAEP